MGTVLIIAAFGMIAAAPAIVWWNRDVARIPRIVWFWSGYDRRYWRRGIWTAFAFGGWPALVVVLAWRRGPQRAALLDEAADLRTRVRHRRTAAAG